MGALELQISAASERVRHEHRLAPLVAPVLRENYRRNLAIASAATGLDELEGALAGEPAILCAAGPSLDEAAPTLREVAASARALRELAETLERRPESLLRGKPEAQGDKP